MPLGDETTPPCPGCWSYKDRTTRSPIRSEMDRNYGNGGYVLHLGTTKEQAHRVLDWAQANDWFDQAFTRATFIQFTLYNPATNLVLDYVMQWESPSTGGFVPLVQTRAVNLYRWGRTKSLIGLCLEMITFAIVLFLWGLEILRIGKQKGTYFKDIYNVITILNLAIFIGALVVEVLLLVEAGKLWEITFSSQEWNEYDITYLVFLQTQAVNINAFNAMLTWLKTLKYVDVLHKKTTQLVLTLSKASSSIVVLLLLFLILFLGFGIAFVMAFGQDVPDYRSMSNAFFALFRAMLGDFDFSAVQQSNKVLGPTLLFAYIIIISLVMLNMFLAVIMAKYDDVVEELELKPEDVPSSIRKLVIRGVKRVVPLDELMRPADAEEEHDEDEDVLTDDQLEQIYEMDKESFRALGIKNWLMLRKVADINMDGTVSLGEIKMLQQAEMAAAREEKIHSESVMQIAIATRKELRESQKVLEDALGVATAWRRAAKHQYGNTDVKITIANARPFDQI